MKFIEGRGIKNPPVPWKNIAVARLTLFDIFLMRFVASAQPEEAGALEQHDDGAEYAPKARPRPREARALPRSRGV